MQLQLRGTIHAFSTELQVTSQCCFYFFLCELKSIFCDMQTPPQVGSRSDLSSYCAQLLRNLDNRQSESPCPLLTHTLPILNSVITHSPDSLTEGDRDTFHIGIKTAEGDQQPY